MTTDPAPLTDAEYQALAEFRYKLRKFMSFSEKAARDHGLASSQHQLLLAVRGHEAMGTAPDIGTLAEWLQLRANTVSELVDRAVAANLVERTIDTEDKRRTLVTTTEPARATLEELTLTHRQEIQRFRSDMANALHSLEG